MGVRGNAPLATDQAGARLTAGKRSVTGLIGSRRWPRNLKGSIEVAWVFNRSASRRIVVGALVAKFRER
jgi:hypothetical protein